MAIALAAAAVDYSRRKQRVRYSVTPSGNYATGGDTVDLTAATDPSLLGAGWGTTVPDFAIENPAIGGKYVAEIIKGADLKTAKLKFSDSTTGNEVAAGAYPAGLIADAGNLFLSAHGFRF